MSFTVIICQCHMSKSLPLRPSMIQLGFDGSLNTIHSFIQIGLQSRLVGCYIKVEVVLDCLWPREVKDHWRLFVRVRQCVPDSGFLSFLIFSSSYLKPYLFGGCGYHGNLILFHLHTLSSHLFSSFFSIAWVSLNLLDPLGT